MGCFQVRYDSRVVIYERKLFIRLATVVSDATVLPTLPTTLAASLVCILDQWLSSHFLDTVGHVADAMRTPFVPKYFKLIDTIKPMSLN